MTGFGKAGKKADGFTFEAEIKSLNNRFLEVSVKLPSELQNREYEIRELVRGLVSRGKVYVTVSVQPDTSEQGGLNLNEKFVAEAAESLKRIREIAGLNEPVTLAHFLGFKELFSHDLDKLTEEHIAVLKDTIREAVDQLVQMRRAEGEQLRKDLESRITVIATTVAEIEILRDATLKEYFERLRQRATEILKDLSAYPERLDAELALLTERCDITEECVRLRSHLKVFSETLKNSNDIGRKMNFLCQEMHREVNTIASKSFSLEIIHHTVSLREEIERIREQVQNIE